MLSERSKLWLACVAAASVSGWGAWLVRSHYASADALFTLSSEADAKPGMPKCADCTLRAGDDEDTKLIRTELLHAHERLASLYLPLSVPQQQDLFELMITHRVHPDTHLWAEDDRWAFDWLKRWRSDLRESSKAVLTAEQIQELDYLVTVEREIRRDLGVIQTLPEEPDAAGSHAL